MFHRQTPLILWLMLRTGLTFGEVQDRLKQLDLELETNS